MLSFNNDEEKDKFYNLYEKYKRLLLYKSREILKDNHLAEDATNEAFIRIYKNLHKIEDINSSQSISFIVTIVRNISLTMIKKQNRSPVVDIFENDITDDFILEDHIEIKISADEIYPILDKLPKDQKDIFILKYANDLSHKEIGKILKITENNVTVKLYRAKKKIDKLIKEKEEKLNEK